MRRVFFSAAFCAAFFLFGMRGASAMVEFCPAQLHYAPVGATAQEVNSDSLFGFELAAFGARTITGATLAFDTSAGWFTAEVPSADLAEKDRHYSAPWVSFIRKDYVSPIMYVRFPRALTIAHAWVLHATAVNDGAFGWQQRGSVSCSPTAVASVEQWRTTPSLQKKNPYTLKAADEDALNAPPGANSHVIEVKNSAPLETADCADPFAVATATHVVIAHFPVGLRLSAAIETQVIVAVDIDGSLTDAWVWGPSGSDAFDWEAVQAAKASTYTAPRAYCKPAPGMYFFRVTFEPN